MMFLTHFYKIGLGQFDFPDYMITAMQCSVTIGENPDGSGDWTVEEILVMCQAEYERETDDALLLPLRDTNPLYEPVLLDFLSKRRADVDRLWAARRVAA